MHHLKSYAAPVILFRAALFTSIIRKPGRNESACFPIVALLAVGIGIASAQDLRPPAQIGGAWTIYAYNIDRPGSSLKTVQLTQQGNIISGFFRGPHQHGKLQGWISGNHIEFSTDTREVLTFRGQITEEGMSGMYGVHGRHAPWRAERNGGN